MRMLEDRVNELKAIIAGNDGRNAADAPFARAVDELVSAVFDDIGRILDLPPRALFDIFLIKVLYVGRRTTHADVIDYLGALLEACLYTRAAFMQAPPATGDGRPRTVYYSDLLDDEKRAELGAPPAEAYRMYADMAMFLAGVFPASTSMRRATTRGALRRGPRRGVDQAYYVTTGAAMYRMAAAHLAAAHDASDGDAKRMTFERLATGFAFYADALNEMSERYIIGKDRALLTDKMLDSINAHRTSADDAHLANARRYAEILHLDGAEFRG